MADPYTDFQAKEAEEEKWLNSRPICSICGEPIQDEYYYQMGDENICESCMAEFRVSNDY